MAANNIKSTAKPVAGKKSRAAQPPPAEDRREQILDAACAVFARDGFHKASIKAIAAEAGLKSPALIYWYFKDKQELFEAVILGKSPVLASLDALEALINEPPEKVLPLVADGYLCMVDNPEGERLFRLFFQEVSRHPQLGEAISRHGFARVKRFLTNYLETQMKLGRFIRHDPRVPAAAFVGGLQIYCITKTLLPALAEDLPPRDVFLKQHVALTIRALRPDGNIAAVKSKSSQTKPKPRR